MATKEEVLAAIAAEKEQVLEAITSLNQKITELEAVIVGGGVVTATDLEEIRNAVNDIFTPSV